MPGEFDISVGGKNFRTDVHVGDNQPILVPCPPPPGGDCFPAPPVPCQSRAEVESSIISAALQDGAVTRAVNEWTKCVNLMAPNELAETVRLTQRKDAAAGSLHDVKINFDQDPYTGNITAADVQIGRVAIGPNNSVVLDRNGLPMFSNIEADINNRNLYPNDHRAHGTVFYDPSIQNADCYRGPYMPAPPCEPVPVYVPQPVFSFDLEFGRRFHDRDRDERCREPRFPDWNRDGRWNGNNNQPGVIVEQHNTTIEQHNTTIDQHNTTINQHNTTIDQHNTTINERYDVRNNTVNNTNIYRTDTPHPPVHGTDARQGYQPQQQQRRGDQHNGHR